MALRENKTVAQYIKSWPSCHFVHCRNGVLRYQTESGFQFDIPVAELGDAAVGRDEKTITFLRWLKEPLQKLLDEDAVVRRAEQLVVESAQKAGRVFDG